ERIARLARLRARPCAQRRIAILMPDYPGAPGRTGYAVGLDVPASVLALLDDLRNAGYTVAATPASSRDLLDRLDSETSAATLSLDDYARLRAGVPADATTRVADAWGEPSQDPDVRGGGFHFRAQTFGNVLVALAPDRGRSSARRADYHDPALPP